MFWLNYQFCHSNNNNSSPEEVIYLDGTTQTENDYFLYTFWSINRQNHCVTKFRFEVWLGLFHFLLLTRPRSSCRSFSHWPGTKLRSRVRLRDHHRNNPRNRKQKNLTCSKPHTLVSSDVVKKSFPAVFLHVLQAQVCTVFGERLRVRFPCTVHSLHTAGAPEGPESFAVFISVHCKKWIRTRLKWQNLSFF